MKLSILNVNCVKFNGYKNNLKYYFVYLDKDIFTDQRTQLSKKEGCTWNHSALNKARNIGEYCYEISIVSQHSLTG